MCEKKGKTKVKKNLTEMNYQDAEALMKMQERKAEGYFKKFKKDM